MSQTIRAFVAVELPRPATAALAAVQERFTPYRLAIRWVRPENIHLTLKFLGDVPAPGVDAAAGALERTAGENVPLDLTVGGLGVFPGRGRPRVLWAGIGGDIKSLERLHRAVDGALANAGFAPESRPFRAHLTLGRPRDRIDTRRLARAVAELGDYAPIGLGVAAISLIRSRLTPTGAVYSRLFTAALTGETVGRLPTALS